MEDHDDRSREELVAVIERDSPEIDTSAMTSGAVDCVILNVSQNAVLLVASIWTHSVCFDSKNIPSYLRIVQLNRWKFQMAFQYRTRGTKLFF